MPLVEELWSEVDENVETEDEVLFLPSDVSLDKHDKFGLCELAHVEYQLREGEANDAVTAICNTVMHKMLLLEAKNKHSRGVRQNMRSLKFINSTNEKRSVWADRYRHARACLLHLAGKQTMVEFPPLTEADMYGKNAAGARGIGDGKATDSWIWTYGRLRAMATDERDNFLFESKLSLVSMCTTL